MRWPVRVKLPRQIWRAGFLPLKVNRLKAALEVRRLTLQSLFVKVIKLKVGVVWLSRVRLLWQVGQRGPMVRPHPRLASKSLRRRRLRRRFRAIRVVTLGLRFCRRTR